jgi:hypothetical protein
MSAQAEPKVLSRVSSTGVIHVSLRRNRLGIALE